MKQITKQRGVREHKRLVATKQRGVREHKRLVARRKIEEVHCFYDRGGGHNTLLETIRERNTWTIIMYGKLIDTKHKGLPGLFRHLPLTWEQLFFIGDSEAVTIYRGNSLPSGYRFTHGIMASAFAFLSREREIATFVLSHGPRGGLHIHMSDTLLVNGHELRGDCPLSFDEWTGTCRRLFGCAVPCGASGPQDGNREQPASPPGSLEGQHSVT